MAACQWSTKPYSKAVHTSETCSILPFQLAFLIFSHKIYVKISIYFFLYFLSNAILGLVPNSHLSSVWGHIVEWQSHMALIHYRGTWWQWQWMADIFTIGDNQLGANLNMSHSKTRSQWYKDNVSNHVIYPVEAVLQISNLCVILHLPIGCVSAITSQEKWHGRKGWSY